MSKIVNPLTDEILSRIFPRFNKLVVISPAPMYQSKKQRYAASLCRCDCGNITIVRNDYLKSLRAKTCGCKKGNHSHGLADTSVYYSWENMKKRCLDPKNNCYHIYGGRGITICASWLESFENFYSDMGDKPSKDHSIDRINNNGNYEPSNCKWSTRVAQSRNRNVTYFVEYKNERKPLAEWADILGIPYYLAYQRIRRDKWSVSKALTTPIHHMRKIHDA